MPGTDTALLRWALLSAYALALRCPVLTQRSSCDFPCAMPLPPPTPLSLPPRAPPSLPPFLAPLRPVLTCPHPSFWQGDVFVVEKHALLPCDAILCRGRYPVHAMPGIAYGVCYAKSGIAYGMYYAKTGIAYGVCYAKSGIAYGMFSEMPSTGGGCTMCYKIPGVDLRDVLCDVRWYVRYMLGGARMCYAMPGTDVAYRQPACSKDADPINSGTSLRMCYAMPGTDIAYLPAHVVVGLCFSPVANARSILYAGTKTVDTRARKSLHFCYAMSGTDIACMSLHSCYAMSGTDIAYQTRDRQPVPGYRHSYRWHIVLRACYAVSGTDTPYFLRACYAVSGTDIAHDAVVLRVPCADMPYAAVWYWMSGTDIPYHAVSLCACYAMSGTDIGCFAMSGTDPAFPPAFLTAKGRLGTIPPIVLCVRFAMSNTVIGLTSADVQKHFCHFR
eukprot:3791138-Rhodomonas_salina.2